MKAAEQMTIFYIPTKIIIGRNCIQENTSLFSALGTRALIVTGKRSAKENGAEQDVRRALEERSIPAVIFDRVESNPSTSVAREAAELAREHKVDLVIGIGGGSPLDAAKVTAVLATNRIDDETLFTNAFAQKPLPVVAVPTTAGTGSEVTQYAMMTNDKVRSKSFVISDDIIPRVALLDAAYTENLPLQVTRNTALDALSHAVEGYLSKRATEMSCFIALESMRRLGRCLPMLKHCAGLDFNVREQLLTASLLAGIVIAQTGTTALHAMGYSLTYFKNIEHGRANGLLMGDYLQYLLPEHQEKVLTVLSTLGFSGIADLKALINDLLGDKEGISEEDIRSFSAIAMKARNIPFTLKSPSQADIEGMFRKSFLP
jgi:alcohol dehydrogenase class IV